MSNSLTNAASVESPDGTHQYLTFVLGGEEYGVNILSVEEIKSGDKITKIPKTPSYILGVMNLRGDIVPVIDLRERFKIEAATDLKHRVVVILNVKSGTGKRVVGVIVDDVTDVYDLSTDQIKPSPDLGNAINIEFIHGIATLSKKIIIVLNSDRLFSIEELSKMDELEEALTS